MWHDAAVGLRESIAVGGLSTPLGTASAVEVVEKKLSFYIHVQHPESVATTLPEE